MIDPRDDGFNPQVEQDDCRYKRTSITGHDLEGWIMSNWQVRWAWVLVPVLLLPASLGAQGTPGPERKAEGAITVAMEDCKATRPRRISSGTSILSVLSALFQGPGGVRDSVVKKGSVTVEGRAYQLYLPKAASYTIKNTGKSDDQFENTCTLISIDSNGDGKLEDAEGWYANMPIRLGDRMFDVSEISKRGDRVVLTPSSAPLRGMVEGFKCPPFSFKREYGEVVSRDQFAGRAFLLDIWSVT
jgi:hypothetical protein